MTDYKRWTDKNWKQFDCSEMYKAFAELEDQIENGTLVQLPCKVGDVVYRVLRCPDFVYGWQVDMFVINSNGIIAFDTSNTIIKPSDWGDTVFLTKAEAEAKLEQLKKEQQQ